MGSVSAIRESVKAMYPGKRWAKNVDRMSEAQVFAIHLKNQRKRGGCR